MLEDEDCAVILTLAGSLISAGLKQAVLTLLEHNMVDAIVATGANVIDQDFFEGLGFRHYQAPGSPEAPPVSDEELRRFAIDRIYDTYIDEDELRICDDTTRRVFESLPPGAYSSRQLMAEMGRYLDEHHPDSESIVRTCYHLEMYRSSCRPSRIVRPGSGLCFTRPRQPRKDGLPSRSIRDATSWSSAD